MTYSILYNHFGCVIIVQTDDRDTFRLRLGAARPALEIKLRYGMLGWRDKQLFFISQNTWFCTIITHPK
jgi:hypothetical protein